MTQNEFIEWLRQHISSPKLEGDIDYLIWLIQRKMATVKETPSNPFCGGSWNAQAFDYYWTPGHKDDSE